MSKKYKIHSGPASDGDKEQATLRVELLEARRQLEVEASLDRIRSQATAMKESHDLLDIVVTMHTEFTALGFQPGYFWHMKWTPTTYEKAMTSGDGTRIGMVMDLPRGFHENQQMTDWEQVDDPIGVFQFDADGAVDYVNRMVETGNFHIVDPNAPTEEDIRHVGGITFIMARTTHGEIGYSLYGEADPAPKACDVLERFAGAFDLAYRRFEDLKQAEAQTREAQIEASLERVRSRAMAMQNSDDLVGVVNVIFNELQLSLETQICILIMHEPDTGDFRWWSTGMSAGVLPQSYHIPNLKTIREHPLVKRYLKDLEEGTPYSVFELSGETKRSADKMWQELTELRNLPEETKQDMMSFEKVILSDAYLKNGMLEIAGPEPLSAEHAETLQRFAKVVEFSYTRTADLQKAEEKAREAQIEASLERVRSRTMGMHSSSEIADVIGQIFDEMIRLDIMLTRCLLWIFNEGEKYVDWWSAHPEVETMATSYKMPYHDHPAFLACHGAWQERRPMWQYTLAGEDKVLWDDHLFNKTELSQIPKMAQAGMREPETVYISTASGDFGLLMTGSLEPLSDENLDIIKRFGRVFQQSYTRFLDVQQAEAQAREAQIGIAVERVRAKALAMHDSKEILGVAVALREEMRGLDLPGVSASTIYLEQSEGRVRVWDISTLEHFESGSSAASDAVWDPKTAPLEVFANQIWRSEGEYAIIKLDADDLYVGADWTRQFDQEASDWLIRALDSGELSEVWISTVPLERGKLCVDFTQPPPEEMKAILPKMAAAFDLAYKRFEDLQKAEAQAREAQIEASLERIRSRSMAMQSSDELAEVSRLLNREVRGLGTKTWGCAFNIYGEDESMEWFGTEVGPMPTYPTPRENVFLRYYEKGQEGEILYIESFEGDNCKAHYEYMLTLPVLGDMLAGIKAAGHEFPSSQIDHVAYFKYGYLLFITLEPAPEAHDVFQRFARVFEQTYTRFLDLKKAEAQAREAQIESALERVRARAMAMHRSDELPEAANLLFEQIKSLGMPAWSAGYCIWDDDKMGITAWMSSEGVLQPPFKAPLTEDSYFMSMRAGYEQGVPLHVHDMGGEALVEHYKYMRSLPVVGEILDSIIDAGHPLPTYQINHCAYFSHGFLLFITYEPVPEAHPIFRRFAKVFDQTYTRFLDLKQAEAQAREAQIEAALERIRTQSLRMQHSSELVATSAVFHNQLQTLGVATEISYVWLPEEAAGKHQFWATWTSEEDGESTHHSRAVTYDLDRSEPYTAACFAAWKSDDPIHVERIPPGDIEHFFSTWEELTGGAEHLRPEHFPDGIYYAEGYMRYGCFGINIRREPTEAERDILVRFAVEFERAYTRFLDLKQAEAQARDAQIEAAMERIRARALAMHSSDELMDVVVEIRRQIDSLGQLDLEASVVHIYPEGEKLFESIAAVRPPGESGEIVLANVVFPVDATDGIKTMMEMYASGEPEYTIEFTKEMAEAWQEVMIEHAPMIAERREGFVQNTRTSNRSEFWNFSDFSEGSLLLVTHSPASDDTKSVLRRAANVFDLAYRRFRDLEKAEAQAREAQIEAGLERIRAAAMAMHSSEEFETVIVELRRQMDALDVHEICFIHLYDDDPESILSMSAYRRPDIPDEISTIRFQIPRKGLTIIDEVLARYESEETDYVVEVDGEVNLEWREFLRTVPPDVYEDFRPVLEADDDTPVRAYWTFSDFAGGSMGLVTHQLPDLESLDLVRRAANVFDLAYRRFKDLKQAEARAREAQIESALEKVRSRSLAMHTSAELGDVIVVIVEKLKDLGVVLDANGVVLCTYFPDSRNVLHWIAAPDFSFAGSYLLPYFDHLIFREAWESKESGAEYFSKGYSKEEKDSFFEHAFEHSDYRKFPDEFKHWVLQNDQHVLSFAWQKNSAILIPSHTGVTPSESEAAILRRFARIFEQSYVRFLDLKHAEAQAREAQIETAVERVRGQAMAMHSSDDLLNVVQSVRRELLDLGMEHSVASNVNIVTGDSVQVTDISSIDEGGEYELLLTVLEYVSSESKYLSRQKTGWDRGEDYYVVHFKEEEMPLLADEITAMDADIGRYLHTAIDEGLVPKMWTAAASFSRGFLGADFVEEPSPEVAIILPKMAGAFDLAYTRFEDLQLAEAQTREAQIEVAMERIRARAMAMHSSDELIEIAAELRQQMEALGQENLQACIIHLYEEGAEKFQSLSALRPPGDTGEIITGHVTFPIDSHESLVEMMSRYASAEQDYSIVLDKEKGDRWQAVMVRESPEFAERINKFLGDIPPADYNQYWNFSDFSGGSVLMVTHAPPTEEARNLLKRSAKVVNLAYRRFLDLKQAEGQAREAKIEAALEKVRGRAMGMQKPDDISDVSILMFDELEALGIESLRSGISIPLEDERYEFHAATKKEDGSTTLVLGNESVNVHPIIRRAYEGWKEQEEYQRTILKGEDLVEYYHAVFDTMPLPDWKERMTIGAEAQEGFSTFPFSDGWMYTFTREEMGDDQIHVFIRFAKVFGLAYQRYHDLKQAEVDYQALLDEKAKTEQVLADLQATQKQLVEQEKLASLGSLTAGIAHEIKNPLNFVNNFAEVSEELVEELSEAISGGDSDEAQSILAEITSNAQQIAKHGKRADSIVKAMMQHARGGSSDPESVDLNEFIEEYVNLSWHGMRARDHGFQAEVIRNFDDGIGELSVQPQEMGRVILNLLNNAFDALKGTDPAQVTVTTRRLDGSVEITIADNGPGIPEDIREKILEPFFTTKATGEGTGLGLSLSYDIVTKGHGGSMTVGEADTGGAQFTIQLPA